MKRLLILLTALLLTACFLLPAALADPFYAAAYGERDLLDYAWDTGDAECTRAYRVRFHNTAKREMTGCSVILYFYDAEGKQLSTATSEWKEMTVASGDEGWTEWVDAPAGTVSFAWKLKYTLKGKDNKLSSGKQQTVTAVSNSLLNTCRQEMETAHRSLQAGTDAMMTSVRVQERFTFTIDGTTGKVKESSRKIRDYFKVSGCSVLNRYTLTVTCEDANGKTLPAPEAVNKNARAKDGTAQWTAWIDIPDDTAAWHLNYKYTYQP